MKEKEKSTALVSLSGEMPITDILAVLDKRLAEIGDISETNYITSGMFDDYNIKSETNISTLVQAHAGLTAREAAYNSSADQLSKDHGIDIPVFKIGKWEVKDYLADIAFRIKVLNSKEKADEVASIKAQLTELMDKEDKKKLIMDKLLKLGTS